MEPTPTRRPPIAPIGSRPTSISLRMCSKTRSSSRGAMAGRFLPARHPYARCGALPSEAGPPDMSTGRSTQEKPEDASLPVRVESWRPIRPHGKAPSSGGRTVVELLLEEGARTLAESQRAQDHSRRLEVETRELILMYRSHRVPQISGGIREVPTADGPDRDRVRARVRLLGGRHETPEVVEGCSRRARRYTLWVRQIMT